MQTLLRIGDLRVEIDKLVNKCQDLQVIDPLVDPDNETRKNFKTILKELRMRRSVERLEKVYESKFGLTGLREGPTFRRDQSVFEDAFEYPDPVRRLEEEKAVLEAEITTLKTALDMSKRDSKAKTAELKKMEEDKHRTFPRRPARKKGQTVPLVTHHRLEFTRSGIERVKPIYKPVESRKRPAEDDDPYGKEAVLVNRDPFSDIVPITDADLGIQGASDPNYPALLTGGSQPVDWDDCLNA